MGIKTNNHENLLKKISIANVEKIERLHHHKRC